jgi:DnaJ-class molecular chaperone
MARLHYVKKARASKNTRTCMTCRKPIEAGKSYKWSEHRAFPQFRYWHGGCRVFRSQQSSSKMGPLWDAIDTFDASGVTTLEDLKALVNEVAEVAEQVKDDYQEGLDAMPQGLQEAAYETQEKIEALNSYYDEVSGWDPEEFTPEKEDANCEECGGSGQVENENPDYDPEDEDTEEEEEIECEVCGGTGEADKEEVEVEETEAYKGHLEAQAEAASEIISQFDY